VEAWPGQSFAGQIKTIAPALDAATRTVRVTIVPTEEETSLLPGMSATVTLLEAAQ